MLLAEFAVYYEFCGETASTELFRLYNNMENIKNSDIKSVVDNSPMPEYILCENEDVMKLRKRRKILKYPHYQEGCYEFMYRETALFFHPIGSRDLDADRIDAFYSKAAFGTDQTVVNVNRR